MAAVWPSHPSTHPSVPPPVPRPIDPRALIPPRLPDDCAVRCFTTNGNLSQRVPGLGRYMFELAFNKRPPGSY
jgi:hypothetical protein